MQRNCDGCGRSYEAKRKTSRYCGSLCRTRASRAGGSKPKIVGLPAPSPGDLAGESPGTPVPAGFVGSVQLELEQAGRLHTVLGQQAIVLAEQMLRPINTGASVASLSKEFRAVMAAAMEGAKVEADPVTLLQEEWRARLELRRSS